MNAFGKIDLHMHTTVSDGTDTPVGIVERVKEAGITLFAVTDHDAIDACVEIGKNRKEGDPAFIPGVELSCKDDAGKYHILGYGFDPDASALNELMRSCHSARVNRVFQRLAFLEETFGFTFSEEDRRELVNLDNPGKPHIGNLMVRYGYAGTKEEAISKYINRYKDKEKRIRPEQAIHAILAAGGIPVLAHPSYGSGEERIVGDDMDGRLRRLIAFGLRGVEAYYSGFPKELRDELLAFSDKYDLYVTAGSDYHGTNKSVKLGDTHLDPDDCPRGLVAFLDACLNGKR